MFTTNVYVEVGYTVSKQIAADVCVSLFFGA